MFLTILDSTACGGVHVGGNAIATSDSGVEPAQIQRYEEESKTWRTRRELEQEIAELEERDSELEDALAAISETVTSALPEEEEQDEAGRE